MMDAYLDRRGAAGVLDRRAAVPVPGVRVWPQFGSRPGKFDPVASAERLEARLRYTAAVLAARQRARHVPGVRPAPSTAAMASNNCTLADGAGRAYVQPSTPSCNWPIAGTRKSPASGA